LSSVSLLPLRGCIVISRACRPAPQQVAPQRSLLAYGTGSVEERLILRHTYLVAEHSILRRHIKGRLSLGNAEHTTLAERSKQLEKQTLEEIATTGELLSQRRDSSAPMGETRTSGSPGATRTATSGSFSRSALPTGRPIRSHTSTRWGRRQRCGARAPA
jgi:hypothetical protein